MGERGEGYWEGCDGCGTELSGQKINARMSKRGLKQSGKPSSTRFRRRVCETQRVCDKYDISITCRRGRSIYNQNNPG